MASDIILSVIKIKTQIEVLNYYLTDCFAMASSQQTK